MTTHTFLLAGANSGIGLATARRLSSAGHQVIAAGRHHDRVESLPGVTCLGFDATEPETHLDLPDTLHGLVYFPGTITLKPAHRLSDEDFLRDFELNLLGAVRLLRPALKPLKNSGSASIVLFSTVAVQTGLPFHASIAAAKGAVEGYARSLAADLAPAIRVNCIAPSLTATPLAENLLNSDAKVEASKERHPLKQVGDPADIAAMVEFLLGPHASFITGQVLKIDGGLSTLRML